MTYPTTPALPAELAELVLLHLPAARVANRRVHDRYLSLAQWTRWAYCILPSGLPTTSLRNAALKFTKAQDVHTWDLLIRVSNNKKALSTDALLDVLARWYKVNRADSHLFAAFDCALINNWTEVLCEWTQPERGLPKRTGKQPQPDLPIEQALERHAFDAVGWVCDHIDDDDRQAAQATAGYAIGLCYEEGNVGVLDKLIDAMGGEHGFADVVGQDAVTCMVEAAMENQNGEMLYYLGM